MMSFILICCQFSCQTLSEKFHLGNDAFKGPGSWRICMSHKVEQCSCLVVLKAGRKYSSMLSDATIVSELPKKHCRPTAYIWSLHGPHSKPFLCPTHWAGIIIEGTIYRMHRIG